MAALVETVAIGPGRRTLTPNTLTASDTFVYRKGVGQTMILFNGTAGAVTPKIVGDAAPVSGNVPGGPLGVNLSTGYSLGSIAVGAWVVLSLDTIEAYLQGNDTIQTGTGLTCVLFSDI